MLQNPSRDSSVHLIGMGWEGSDEAKFQRTFGCGRSMFGRFSDLQELGTRMGYHQLGLKSMSELLLSVEIGKSRRVRIALVPSILLCI